MPAAKAKAVQQTWSGCGDEMEIPRFATGSRGSGSEQQDRWLGSQFG
jgi:hypothetical protein